MAYTPPNPNGQATKANSAPVVIASDDDLQAKLGVVTETAPGTDTASSGLNGRLQRIAQRLTSLIDGMASTYVVNDTLNSAGDSTVIACDGHSTALVQLSGSFNGAIEFQLGTDGSSYTATRAYVQGTRTIVSSASASGLYRINISGAKSFRLFVTSYTSGSMTVNATVTRFSNPVDLLDVIESLQLLDDVVATDGAAVLTKGYQIAGTDGTNAQIISVTNTGRQIIEEAGAALTSLQLLDDTVVADNAGFTDGTTKVSINGFIFDETAGTALTENDAAAARIDSKRAQVLVIEDATTRGQRAGVNSSGGMNITPIPHTSGGLSTYHLSSAATTNATVVKASAGQLYGWYIYNNNSSMRKVAFHNASSTPTAGASIFMTLCIPGSSGANVMSETGIAFSTGIAITTVTGAADSNATAVGADDLNINLFYK